MESRRKIIEGRRTISRRVPPNAREHFDSIPKDLVQEILSRLPTKLIVKFRCVSKTWDSIFRSASFTEQILSREPLLLFVCLCRNEKELLFFSAPQPQDDLGSDPVTVNFHMKFAFDRVDELFAHVSGLVCLIDKRYLQDRKTEQLVTSICNPTTGQCVTLPKMNTREWSSLKSFLGYDPVEKHFKVLSMASSYYFGTSKDHQVLTLGTGESSWRMIQCGFPHCPTSKVICINGVLYYSVGDRTPTRDSVIVCFDVRNEKFSSIQLEGEFIDDVLGYSAILFNYNGKLASFTSTTPGLSGIICGTTTSLQFCVLQDPETNKWERIVCDVSEQPHIWKNVVGDILLRFVGVTGTDVVVLSSHYPYNPFYVFYYNTKKKTMTRAEIQGFKPLQYAGIRTFISHVENLKLMQPF